MATSGASLTPLTHELSNGLRIRLLPNHDAKVVAYQTVFRVGSRNERLGRTGMAHLFEHMMFNGATKYGPKEFDQQIEAHGGSSNAYTSTDLTVYHDEVPAEALELLIDLESDRMAGLKLDEESLRSEREVVKEERRLRVEDSIFGRLDEELGALVYQAHPYRWPVIGWMGDLDQITVEDCRAFFRQCYAPNNATVYLAGDFDPDATLARLTQAYGALPSAPVLEPPVNSEPEQKGQRRSELEIPAQNPALLMAFRGVAATNPLAGELDLLSVVLTYGEGSLLVRELIHERQLCTEVSSDHSWRIDPGMFLLAADLAADSSVKRVEKLLLDRLADLAETPLKPAVIERAKAQVRMVLLRERQTALGRCAILGNCEHLLNQLDEADRQEERLRAITPKSLREAAEAIFKTERSCMVWVDP